MEARRATANGAHRAQSSSLHGVLLDLFVAAILHAIGRGVPPEAQELGKGIGYLERWKKDKLCVDR